MLSLCLVFFFNDTATTEIYTLSLHDALPIFRAPDRPEVGARAQGIDRVRQVGQHAGMIGVNADAPAAQQLRSEEHTSELQSHSDLVCRLLLEKKKNKKNINKSVYKSSTRVRV